MARSPRCAAASRTKDGVYEVTATPWRAGEHQLVLHVEGDDSADENGGGGRGRTAEGARDAVIAGIVATPSAASAERCT